MPSDARHVVAVPYPGRGHINAMLNLCRLLASRSILVTFVVTEEWLGFLRADSAPPPPSEYVRFASIPNVIPSEIGRAQNFSGFIEAVYTKMEPPFEQLLDRLEPPATGILADIYVPWTVAVGNRRNIPVFSLFTMSASFFSVLHHFDPIPAAGDRQLPVDSAEKADEPLGKYIPGHNSIRLSDLHSMLNVGTPLTRALEAVASLRRAQCILFTSFYELEPQVIDTLQANLSCPVYPIGPSIPYMLLDEKTIKPDYIEWLDSQPENSVLYVSLGSFLSVSGPQMDEIATGVSLSGTRFLWVARSDSSLPQAIIGSAAGLVVPWCDQLKVLCHPSVGGFLTHCGWNSTLEGVFGGVPMLTFPIFWDQPVDSRQIVDEWKVGLSLRGEVIGREEIVGREEIAKVVRRLMDLDGDESKEMRRRAAELRAAARKAIGDGGSSDENLSSFVRLIMEGSGI